MPLYEYECEQCGDLFEVMQKFSDEPLTVHEKCGGKVHRLISAPALQFKGSGWYITDYARSSKTGGNGTNNSDSAESKPAAGSDKSSTGSSGTSDSGSSTKPAATSESK
jgi:putative FmdB family regulatory protein